jgi:hypothetical protein
MVFEIIIAAGFHGLLMDYLWRIYGASQEEDWDTAFWARSNRHLVYMTGSRNPKMEHYV